MSIDISASMFHRFGERGTNLRKNMDTHSRLESCVKVREELVVRSVGSARCHVQEPVTILVDVGSGLAH